MERKEEEGGTERGSLLSPRQTATTPQEFWASQHPNPRHKPGTPKGDSSPRSNQPSAHSIGGPGGSKFTKVQLKLPGSAPRGHLQSIPDLNLFLKIFIKSLIKPVKQDDAGHLRRCICLYVFPVIIEMYHDQVERTRHMLGPWKSLQVFHDNLKKLSNKLELSF